MKGDRVVDDGVLSYIREHILLRYTSLSLEQIRDMDMYDFEIHGQLAMIFQAGEQGAFADTPAKKAPTAAEVLGGTGVPKGGGTKTMMSRQRFDPNIGDFVNT